ncbi:MAG TPA: hypothetical protein VMT76_02310 [Puia sp.]|nr:hypothetical protein [Puia sp.]
MKIFIIRYALLSAFSLSLSVNVFSQIPAQVMPEFQFLKRDKTIFANKDVALGKMTFFGFFDVDCDHCQKAIKNIEQQYPYLRQVYMCLISTGAFDKMDGFLRKYAPALQNKRNVEVLQDNLNQFISKFKPYRYPAMFLYSSEKKLLDYEDNEESVFRFTTIIKNQSQKNKR